MTAFAGTNMKRTAAILLCSAALGITAFAQSTTPPAPAQDQTQGPPPQGGGPGGGRRGGNPEQRLAMMQSQLNLTPDQTEKVKAIMADGRTQMMALRNDSSASQSDRREKMMGLMKTENEKIKAVLTPDQRTKFEQMEKKQREQMRERRREGGDATPPPAPPQS